MSLILTSTPQATLMSAKRTLSQLKATSKRRPFWSLAASWGCLFIGLVLASTRFCFAFTSSADVDSSVSSLVRSRAIYVVDDDKEVTMLRREFRHDALYRYVMYRMKGLRISNSP
jgi:hypothetical protein